MNRFKSKTIRVFSFLLFGFLISSCGGKSSCDNEAYEKIEFTESSIVQLNKSVKFIHDNLDTLYSFGCSRDSECDSTSTNDRNYVYLNSHLIEKSVNTNDLKYWNKLTEITTKKNTYKIDEVNFSRDKVINFSNFKTETKCDTTIKHSLLYLPKGIILNKRGYYVEHSYSEKLTDNWVYIITKCLYNGDHCEYIMEK